MTRHHRDTGGRCLRRRRVLRALAVASALASTAGCAAPWRPAAPERASYAAPVLTSRGTELGVASWYGPGFDGKRTASGEIYDQNAMTAAHRTLPLGTLVAVTEVDGGRSVEVRINDRGSYKHGRMLDLSYAAAKALAMVERGTAPVEIRVLGGARYNWPATYYSVQIGAFTARARADQAGRAAAHHGERAYLVTAKQHGTTHYRVRVGPFSQRRDAVRASSRLERAGFDPLVVEESPATAHYFEARSSTRAAELSRDHGKQH